MYRCYLRLVSVRADACRFVGNGSPPQCSSAVSPIIDGAW